MEADTHVVQLTDSVDTGSKKEHHRCSANKAVISYTSANAKKSENHSDELLVHLIITSHINKWCIPLAHSSLKVMIMKICFLGNIVLFFHQFIDFHPDSLL